MPDEFDDEESPRSKTGRFSVPHRGDTRVEVEDPINVGGDKPWLCGVKLMGKTEQTPDGDSTQTLYLRTGRGFTPEEAQRDAMAQLALVVGSPVGPAPEPRISRKQTDPPPSSTDRDTERRMAVPSTPPPASIRDVPTERNLPVAADSSGPPTERNLRAARTADTIAPTDPAAKPARPTEPAPASGWLSKLLGTKRPGS